VVDLDDVALVVSELMTNSLRAGCEQTHLRIDIDEQRLLVAVTDDAPGEPHLGALALHESHGRGLQLVAALAVNWGVKVLRHGKEVWAELSLLTPETG
jgi:anti-sigma regulatory factor (Ser/Thr protein kinase)